MDITQDIQALTMFRNNSSAFLRRCLGRAQFETLDEHPRAANQI